MRRLLRWTILPLLRRRGPSAGAPRRIPVEEIPDRVEERAVIAPPVDGRASRWRRVDRIVAVLGSVVVVLLIAVVAQRGASALGPALAVAALWGIGLIWKVPQWQAESRRAAGLSEKELFELENSARATLGQFVSAVALLLGLFFAWRQLGSTSDTLNLSEQGQITERFTRAVDQLGSEDVTIRLGGIFALERIARDSDRDAGPVMEVLTAYVREHAPRHAGGTDPATPATASGAPPVDVQAVLDVIARRAGRDPTAPCLNLEDTDLAGFQLAGHDLTGLCLRGADLSGAIMNGANMHGVDLSLATLVGASLNGADLREANLAGADLSQADLTRARLDGARLDSARMRVTILQDASLHDAVLQGADLGYALLFGADFANAELSGADLTGAAVAGADLGSARSLTQAQIDSAAPIDDQTTLPPGLHPATPP